MENSPIPTSKHIVWIGKESSFSNRICHWTLEWLDTHRYLAIDTITRTSGFEGAVASLEEPLKMGTAPEMVIVDRSIKAVGFEHFAAMVSDCIPECWIVELVSNKDTVPRSRSVIYMQKNFKKNDWLDLLYHCFVESPNPQWSKSLKSTS